MCILFTTISHLCELINLFGIISKKVIIFYMPVSFSITENFAITTNFVVLSHSITFK